MTTKQTLSIIAGVVVVCGAVYWVFQPGTQAPAPTPASSLTNDVPSPTPTPSPTPASTATASDLPPLLPLIDETWKSYTSASGGFTFKWPTRGKYAPTWDVDYVATGCAEGSTSIDVQGVKFCHNRATDGAAGTMYFIDTYKTQQPDKYIQITFTKPGYSSGALECSFMNEYPYSTSPSTCTPFVESDYQQHLDQIISTFRYTTR